MKLMANYQNNSKTTSIKNACKAGLCEKYKYVIATLLTYINNNSNSYNIY